MRFQGTADGFKILRASTVYFLLFKKPVRCWNRTGWLFGIGRNLFVEQLDVFVIGFVDFCAFGVEVAKVDVVAAMFRWLTDDALLTGNCRAARGGDNRREGAAG